MPEISDPKEWVNAVRRRYENYLRTSFYFKDPALRTSFQQALQREEKGDNQNDGLLKGPFHEHARNFSAGAATQTLAEECFPDASLDLQPALFENPLYAHQDSAIRAVYGEQQNAVIATGTGSGKTECFLYPILFSLYQQHLDGRLKDPGVRALILYPMNALANDQRERLGGICKNLRRANSDFQPTFGQYIGTTPENGRDSRRSAQARIEETLPGEMIFREEMRENPPHILLTNYSMLEYLLIRPRDCQLFDNGRGRHWQFIVLDEAHQYRGAKGMEMGMLMRRLKQRLRDGGREDPFRCIATSATIASNEDDKARQAVADFAGELFGEESFLPKNIIFGEYEQEHPGVKLPLRRYHAFVRALEGAFLIYRDGEDAVILNRKKEPLDNGAEVEPLEIALCRECGQHYYVGRIKDGKLVEAVRDPSQWDFGVDYYFPAEDPSKASHILCRLCGKIAGEMPDCTCKAAIPVWKCTIHDEHQDQLKECEACGYSRGSIGDPVQEIVHGSDGPNAVIATALHESLPENKRKILAFADSRQEAAFFAWYAEDSYTKVSDRNLMLRALREEKPDLEGLSINDLKNRLTKKWESAGILRKSATEETKKREVLKSIFREALTDERRLSLAGVGLVRWSVKIPDSLNLPESLRASPWGLSDAEAYDLTRYLLDTLRLQRAVTIPEGSGTPAWNDITSKPQQSYGRNAPEGQKRVRQWGGPSSGIVTHFLRRLLKDKGLSVEEMQKQAVKLMKDIWKAIRECDRETPKEDRIFVRGETGDTFRLNFRWLRLNLVKSGEIFECNTCASLTAHNIRGVCPRYRCPGILKPADPQRLSENHYRILYESRTLPPLMHAEEHTAQISSEEARVRQDSFKNGGIHLLSSSTTFEVGVDLGDLDVVFLRNVPPEPFNYTQRVGRTGRRDTPGLALTYCRRSPHDLYHYADPEERMIRGKLSPPRLHMTNDKIISRHMTAVALSDFFKAEGNHERFKSVEAFIGNWKNPQAVADLKKYCKNSAPIEDSLRQIVPESMHEAIGLNNSTWIDRIAGEESRFERAEKEVCNDFLNLEKLREEYINAGRDENLPRLKKQRKTIAEEKTLNFLSRKAIIPKYGFPVDVVELDTHSSSHGVSLQRDLSQAIAEYAPGSSVVASKKEFKSCGVKIVHGKACPVRRYTGSDPLNFRQGPESEELNGRRRYLSPIFGFVTPLFENPGTPHGRVRRLYTTRPFFQGFEENKKSVQPVTKKLFGIDVRGASPGMLVVLCEGKDGGGFYICRTCGGHEIKPKKDHKTPAGQKCLAPLENLSLGHELVTDVMRLQFPLLADPWDAYSLGFALLRGASEALSVPETDMNITIARGEAGVSGQAIILYDNVPGGAGLVVQLEQDAIFDEMLRSAYNQVEGICGCDASCYGCLRSYRNQFAHPHLSRIRAREFLEAALATKGR